jgi:C4-dicarboxylate-binding protein DctP
MSLRIVLAALLLAIVPASLTFLPAAADPPIVIKFSHVAAPQSHKALGVLKFKELAEAYTDGRVKVEVFPNSQLYKDREELEALQLGAVQMLAPSLSKFGPLGVRAFEVFDLPYLFKDYKALRQITHGAIGRELLDKLTPKGIVGLAYWDNGFKILSANQQLKSPDDLLGLKMRIQSSKVIENQMQTLGALPQVTAYSEAYQALSSGVVNGTENPPSNMYTMKMYEVQTHATLTNHGYLGYAVITNKSFWEGLPGDIRATLEKALSEATDYSNQLAAEENSLALSEMEKAGKTVFHVPTEDERQVWIDAMRPVHKAMEKRIGRDIIQRIYQETGQSQ